MTGPVTAPESVVTHTFIPAVPQADVCRCGIPAEPHHSVHERTEDEE